MKPIRLIIIFSFANLVACSQFFPDKEKDYVNSHEIPPLQIPPSIQVEKLAVETKKVIAPLTLSKSIEYKDQDKNNTYVSINSSFAHVWRLVGKALTQRAIEITDKNRSTGIYYVQYNPNVQAVRDGTFWDEFVFFFSSDKNQKTLYQLFLTESELGTDIFVRDQLGNKLSQDDGIKLLNLIFKTIKQDL